ncbi:MAG: MerR family transcriptional regulator [Clostridia bacterium]
MKHGVGDVARVLGLTPGALHYYEREGLMNVSRAGSGHRYYDDGDLWRLLSYKKYHTMGTSIKVVMDQFTGGGARDTIVERMRDRQDEALKKSAYYAELAQQIEEHLDGVERIDELLDRYAFERAPETLFVGDEQYGWMALDRAKQDVLHEWVEAMPAVRLAIYWPITGFEEAALCVPARLGYAIEARHNAAARLSALEALPAIALPAVSCLHTVVTEVHDFIYEPQIVFQNAANYARLRGFRSAGAAWGRILLVETNPNGLFRANVELWMPIE